MQTPFVSLLVILTVEAVTIVLSFFEIGTILKSKTTQLKKDLAVQGSK